MRILVTDVVCEPPLQLEERVVVAELDRPELPADLVAEVVHIAVRDAWLVGPAREAFARRVPRGEHRSIWSVGNGATRRLSNKITGTGSNLAIKAPISGLKAKKEDRSPKSTASLKVRTWNMSPTQMP